MLRASWWVITVLAVRLADPPKSVRVGSTRNRVRVRSQPML